MDIDIAAVVVAATAEVIVGITILIVADGIDAVIAISISILLIVYCTGKVGSRGLVEHSRQNSSSVWIVRCSNQRFSALSKGSIGR
jgi:hypothetical protein